jgi:uncharacterized protein
MLMDVFTNASMPFYKFGDLMFLEKIKKTDWIKFIISVSRIQKKSRKVTQHTLPTLPIAILIMCSNWHSKAGSELTKSVQKKSFIWPVTVLSISLVCFFKQKLRNLQPTRLNLLKAVLEGVKQFSSKDTLDNYELGTSPNITRIKKALENKEIIDLHGQEIFPARPHVQELAGNPLF